MRKNISAIKAGSREYMLDKYGAFMPMLLLYFLLDIAAALLPDLFFSSGGTVNEISRIGMSFIISLFLGLAGVGLIKAALDVLHEQPVKTGTLFYAFSNRSNRFLIIQLIFTVIKTVLVLPIIPLNSYMSHHKEMSFLAYYGIYMGIQVFALFVTMLVTIRIIWANYFMLEDINLDAGDALKMSLSFSKGRTLEMLYMKLSFIGMYILGYCSMLIGFLYIRPYAEVTFAKYYLEKKESFVR